MAWRIDRQVIRGEIDNRERDRVRGRVWLTGREQPLELSLEGNALRDLAGRRLVFENPQPGEGDLRGLRDVQDGQAGDITAARKCRVPELPIEECLELAKQGLDFPWHLANTLYLEWYSMANGRVVIEASDYVLRVDTEAAWEMTPEEEQQQMVANHGAVIGFMDPLVEAMQDDDLEIRRIEREEQEDRPTSKTEAQAEQETAWMDTLTRRIHERMEREGLDAENYARIYREERERLRQEGWDPHGAAKEDEEGETTWLPWDDESETEDGFIRSSWVSKEESADEEHDDEPDDGRKRRAGRPALVKRASDLALRIMRRIEEEDWLPEGHSAEHPLQDLIENSMIASAKMAGALGCDDDFEWPPAWYAVGDTLVRLKKARAEFRSALRMLDECEARRLAEMEWLAEVRAEVRFLLAAVSGLIDEAREGLEES